MINKLKDKTTRLLRWSEQYTKTDMVYLAKGGFWTWLGRGVVILTGIATAIAFANLLPKEVYGNYKYILSVAGILGIFTLNGLTSSIIRSVSQGFEGSLKQGAKEMFKWSSFIFFFALATAGYYFWQENNLLAGGMLLVAFFQPIIKVGGLYKPYLIGKKLFKAQGIYLLIWESIQAILIISALFFTNNALILVGILFAINALISSLYLWHTLKNHVSNEKISKETIPYSKHLSVMSALEVGALHLDKVLIFQTLGAIPTAVYSFALLPRDRLDSFFRSISEIILPKFSNKPLEALQKTIWKKALVTFIFSLTLTVVCIWALPSIFSLLFPEYMDSVIYAQWLTISLIFIPDILYSQALIAHAKKKPLYIMNVSSNLLKIVLLLVLLPLYGIWGAVYALLGYLLYQTLIKMYLFYRIKPQEIIKDHK